FEQIRQRQPRPVDWCEVDNRQFKGAVVVWRLAVNHLHGAFRRDGRPALWDVEPDRAPIRDENLVARLCLPLVVRLKFVGSPFPAGHATRLHSAHLSRYLAAAAITPASFAGYTDLST